MFAISTAFVCFWATSLFGGLDTPDDFKPIFNGKDLTGWHGMPHFDPNQLDKMSAADREAKIGEWTADAKKHWSVDKGALVNDGNGAYLTTDKEYGDIEMVIDYKTVAQADSGIYLRATPQVQIWDYTEAGGKWKLGADKGSGGLWNNRPGAPGKDPLVLADKPFGEWNHFRILQVGERVTVHLNDKLVVDHARLEDFWSKSKLPLRRNGVIQLQTHGGEIRWENIALREIGSDEANKILATKNKEGYKSVFNGTDFTGWSGPTENYEVVHGSICCKPKKGGFIHTTEEYADFAVRTEFKLPPGGNNGLAIRYPGKGDGAYAGMCEVQILDDTHPMYAKIDPRQACGSVYGMIPAHRGYLRPVGEWNFIEVTVKGPTIVVELNGTRILDGDVSKVTEFMGGHPHPGKDLPKGHFGFCGHHDPVEFRNVQIRTL